MAAAAMGRKRRRARGRAWSVWARPGSEVAALLVTALVGVITALGWLADAGAGASPWWHLVLFAAGVLVLGIGAATLLRAWLGARRWLARRGKALPAGAAPSGGGSARPVSPGRPFRAPGPRGRPPVRGGAPTRPLALPHPGSGPRPPQPPPHRLPRCRHAPPLPRRDARRSLPRAPRVQHRAAQRRAPCHHGAVRRARLRDHPALPEHAAARLPDPRPVRRPRLPPLAHRGTATALRGRRAAHPERRRSGTDRGARLMRGRHRIYLVPGFFGFTNLGELGYFQHVLEFLRAHATADVHVVRTHPTASLPQRAARVVETVAATMGRDGPVHLIGHSSGGLDARLAVAPRVSLPGRQDVQR